MAISTIDGELLEAFAGSVSGSVLLPHDDGYEEARRIQNGLIDRRPALIVRCPGATDIAEAVKLARSSGLEISVRGGGHNVAGRAVAEGGLMIDLSPMRGIHVDPAARTARAQGGVLWAELNREAHAHGLAVTGGAISSTGIAGYTLGGGLGWLMAKHGLGCDNLLGVELVTADGEIRNVDDASHPGVMCALRGGGAIFAVAASLVYRLRPVSMVPGGLIAPPIDAGGDILRFYRDAIAGASGDLSGFAGLTHAPERLAATL